MKKLKQYIEELSKKMNFRDRNEFKLSERPIDQIKDDVFDVEKRIVNRMLDFIHDLPESHFTLAVTGEWGQGKSSVINILQNKLKDKLGYKVITFEPLLEGKFEIADIINIFYLKLHQVLTSVQAKKVIEKIIKGFAILTRAKITVGGGISTENIGMPDGRIEGKIVYDWEKNVDDLIRLYDEKEPVTFAEQTKDLNKLLKKDKIRLIVVIDEIDRLPAKYILNFLMFCRILETFDNLVSVVGIDYEQVVNKLINEGTVVGSSYNDAKNYIDKLFQVKFHVQHGQYKKIQYAISQLKKIDIDGVLSELTNSEDYKVSYQIGEIFIYLSTPRQIKKWLFHIKKDYYLLKSMPNKLDFLQFLAVTVKHPLVMDYLSKYGVGILSNRTFLKFHLENNFDITISDEDIENDDYYRIIVACLGMIYSRGLKNRKIIDTLQTIVKKVCIQKIKDPQAAKYSYEFLKLPKHLIILFVTGHVSEDYVQLYSNFFGGNINKALQSILEHDEENDFAFDIAETLSKGNLEISDKPDLDLVENLWRTRANENGFGNPYVPIVSYCLRKFSIDEVIENAPIAMSERYICRVIDMFGIKNEKSAYDLETFHACFEGSLEEKSMQDITFNEEKIKEFSQKTIEEILRKWLAKASEDFKSCSNRVFNQPNLINVFYRYIQWGHTLGTDNREKLALLLVDYINDESSEADTVASLKKAIITEYVKFEGGNFFPAMQSNPYEVLFNNYEDLLKLLSE